MRRVPWLFIFLLLIPQAASPIQLRWSSGTSDLTFSEATRCTLVVQADSSEGRLPPEWRLQWVSDSLAIQFVAAGSGEACLLDEAQVSQIDPPATAADSAANLITAHFCSDESETATLARQVVDLPGGGRGKLKVVALDPSDPDRIITSNEVRYNGGVEGGYPPVVLGASSAHHHGDLTVRLRGAGLGATDGLSIAAPDTSWRYPLTITARSDMEVVGTTTIAAPVPACQAEAIGLGGSRFAAPLPADSFDDPLSPQDCIAHFYGSQDTFNLQPRDFSFVFTGDTWHLFYIRQHQTQPYLDNPNANTRNLGHAVSTDLQNWSVVARNVLQVQDGQWDNAHVWAPSVILNKADLKYYMFYTGVSRVINNAIPPDTMEIQRIGVATSLNLTDWTHENDWIYSHNNALWAAQDTTHENGWQFRDPYVMAAPDTAGHYLMYFVAIHAGLGRYVVGTARSHGNLRAFFNTEPLLKTNASYTKAGRIESPHAFDHHGKWWMMYTSNYPWGDRVHFEVNATSPVNADSSSWSNPVMLREVACGQHDSLTSVYYWHASEHDTLFYRTPSGAPSAHEYLAAFSDLTQSIDFTEIVLPPANCSTDSVAMNCPSMVAVEDPVPSATRGPAELALAGASPVRSRAELRLELQSRMRVHVAVYDVLGRRLRTLLDGELPAGSSRLSWDGRDAHGVPAGPGLYFARLTCAAGHSVVRLPLLK